MTITWGREIPVDGKRPAWLRDDEQRFRVRWNDNSEGNWAVGAFNANEWAQLTAIRLPADHFAYKALDAGFEPWGGGESAPEDWDGSEAMCGDGSICRFGIVSWWDRTGRYADIIGYRKKVEPVGLAVDWAKPIHDIAHGNEPLSVVRVGVRGHGRSDLIEICLTRYMPNPSPCITFLRTPDNENPGDLQGSSVIVANVPVAAEGDPAALVAKALDAFPDFVAVKRMTEAEARERWHLHSGINIAVLHDLGLIREETVAERFTRETGHAVTPEVEAALNWRQAA